MAAVATDFVGDEEPAYRQCPALCDHDCKHNS